MAPADLYRKRPTFCGNYRFHWLRALWWNELDYHTKSSQHRYSKASLSNPISIILSFHHAVTNTIEKTSKYLYFDVNLQENKANMRWIKRPLKLRFETFYFSNELSCLKIITVQKLQRKQAEMWIKCFKPNSRLYHKSNSYFRPYCTLFVGTQFFI